MSRQEDEGRKNVPEEEGLTEEELNFVDQMSDILVERQTLTDRLERMIDGLSLDQKEKMYMASMEVASEKYTDEDAQATHPAPGMLQ